MASAGESTTRSSQHDTEIGVSSDTPMKRSGSAVKFAEPEEDANNNNSSSSSSKGQQKGKLRYGRILSTLTGGGHTPTDSPPALQPSDSSSRKSFNPAAAPAKPAMKPVRSPSAESTGQLYPAVDEEGNPIVHGSAHHPNPATGLVGYHTRGGAALASALGVEDGLTIPAPCPPALPNTAATSGGSRPGSWSSNAAYESNTHQLPGCPVKNPLAVEDMPHMAPLAGRPSAAAGAGVSVAMPAAAQADGTVQLTAHNGSADKLHASDLGDSSLQRDQHTVGAAEYQKHGGAAGWQVLAAAGAEHNCSKDIEADEGEEDYSPTGAAGKAGSINSDGESSAVIIPPGSQTPLPPFWSQLTIRAVLVGLFVGACFLLLNMRLALVTGIAPNLQVVIAGACWILLRGTTLLLGRDMQCIASVNAQEVSVAAAAALAVASTAAAGGFGSVLLAIQNPAAQRVGSSVAGNLPSIVWSLAYGKLLCYLLMVALSGAMLMLAFRKPLFTSPAMTFATGAATGQLLNTLHTPAMSYHGHKQMNRFTQWSVISFLFSGYQWVFNNPACHGFTRFPTLGLQALRYSWNFDFQLSLCGLGIIAPISVAWSLVVGAVLSWGLLWPILSSKEGEWFPAGLQSWDIKGAYGYHLITAMALLLADAVYHTVRGLITAFLDWRNPEGSEEAAAAATAAAASSAQEASPSPMHGGELGPGLKQRKPKKKRSKHAWKLEALKILDSDTLSDASTLQFSLAAMERALRQHIFMSDAAWSWAGIVGFVVLSAVTVGALPVLFSIGSGAPAGGADMATASGLQWYFLLVAAPLTAMAAFANARGGGAVDINLADSWAKLAVLIFAAWAGTGNAGSVGAGLLCGGVVLGATTSALNTMYAWRSGYMTMTSPTAIFVAYMIGLAVGCVVAPAAWLMLESTSVAAAAVAASPLTTGGLLAPDKFYASPLVSVFRSTAALATAGLSVLPHAAPYVALAAFVVGLGLNLVRESLPSYLKGVVPYPAAVGVVFLSGANVAVDVVVGAAIRIFWRLRYPRSAEAYNLAVGCALIAGEGLWGLGKGLLGAFGVQPPICMSFTPAPTP